MKTATAIVLGVVAVIAIVAAFMLIDVDQTQETALPDVDVEVEEGQLPEYDVETGSVDVTTEEETVTVPDVDVEVDTEQAEVTVPQVEVNTPDEEEAETTAQ